MRAEFGFCMVCDREVAPKDPVTGIRAKNGYYTEVEVAWSNKSRMNIAVCKDCAGSHAWATDDAKRGLTQAHWDAWDKAGGKYDREIVIV